MLVNGDNLGTGGAPAYELVGTPANLKEIMQPQLYFALRHGAC
jgi:hypothetical protein